jgi:hypothetical protein
MKGTGLHHFTSHAWEGAWLKRLLARMGWWAQVIHSVVICMHARVLARLARWLIGVQQ